MRTVRLLAGAAGAILITLCGLTAAATSSARPVVSRPLSLSPGRSVELPALDVRESDAQPAIYDLWGRRVRTFDPDSFRANAAPVWDGRDDHGRAVAPGGYFVAAVPNAPDAAGTSVSPPCWLRVRASPVLPRGPAGAWDSAAIRSANVEAAPDGAGFAMMYDAYAIGSEAAFGFAESPDRVTWTRSPLPVFEGDVPGTWDEWLAGPTLRTEGSSWELWYTGSTLSSPGPISIGRATSPDGFSWTRDPGNPLLNGGPPGSWNEAVVSGNVFFDDDAGLYRMYFHVIQLNPLVFQIALATSANGSSWTMHTTPVLTPGPGWDSFAVACPYVFRGPDGYEMYYHGSTGDTLRIGYATSADGIAWTKYPGNPIVQPAPPGGWDSGDLACPNLYADEVSLGLYYTSDGVGLLMPRNYRSERYDADPPAGARRRISGEILLSPNPFRDFLEVTLSDGSSPLRAAPRVYDVRGHHLADLAGLRPPWRWDGRTRSGTPVPSGAYWLRVETEDGVRTARIVRMR